MALNKIQSIVGKISGSQKLQDVLTEAQRVSDQVQSQVKKLNHKINKDEAVKQYKSLVKKLLAKEAQLQSEINQVVGRVKSTAHEVEKNFEIYKAKAKAQRAKLEKIVRDEVKTFTKAAQGKGPKARAAAAQAKKNKTSQRVASKKSGGRKVKSASKALASVKAKAKR